MTLTTEQKEAINLVKNTNGVITINALAGCSKTFTSIEIVKSVKPKRVFYTAFNKGIVEESKSKFPANVECRTMHSFCLKYVRPKKNIEDFTYTCITEPISYTSKKLIIDTMNKFYLSDSVDLYEFVDKHIAEDEELAELCANYTEAMLTGKIAPTFNMLLKYLHLQLAQGNIEINDYDLVIVDEVQDIMHVFLEIVKLINAPKKVLVGDTNQNIYSEFMNTVNAFDLIKGNSSCELTTTFRCSSEIAQRVENFGRDNLSKSFRFKGVNTDTSDLSIAYISSTNSALIDRMSELLNEGFTFHLLRKPSEIFALPMALLSANAGKEVYQKKYKYLNTEYGNYMRNYRSKYSHFFAYLSEEVDEEDTNRAIALLSKFRAKRINLFQLYNTVKEMKPVHDITLTTAFTSKGLEYGTVHILNDLNDAIEEILNTGVTTQEDLIKLRLGYVAMTRAKHTLVNCKFA